MLMLNVKTVHQFLSFFFFFLQPEGIAIEAREVLLERAAQGTINFVMNK